MKSQINEKIVKIDYIDSLSFYDEYIICNLKESLFNEFASQDDS